MLKGTHSVGDNGAWKDCGLPALCTPYILSSSLYMSEMKLWGCGRRRVERKIFQKIENMYYYFIWVEINVHFMFIVKWKWKFIWTLKFDSFWFYFGNSHLPKSPTTSSWEAHAKKEVRGGDGDGVVWDATFHLSAFSVFFIEHHFNVRWTLSVIDIIKENAWKDDVYGRGWGYPSYEGIPPAITVIDSSLSVAYEEDLYHGVSRTQQRFRICYCHVGSRSVVFLIQSSSIDQFNMYYYTPTTSQGLKDLTEKITTPTLKTNNGD